MPQEITSREEFWRLQNEKGNLPKRKNASPEADMQVTAFCIIRHARNAHLSPDLTFIYSIPNGGLRHPKVAIQMKAEGALAGVSDVKIPAARHGYGGCYIENKSATGAMSKDQRKFRDYILTQNYYFAECYTLDAMLDVVDWYLSIKLDRFDGKTASVGAIRKTT